MKKLLLILFLTLFSSIKSEGKTAYILPIKGAIGPVTYYKVKKVLKIARIKNAEFVILTLDTPGGLLFSTRKIVQEILKSPVPVIGFVYPQGAQCASAGTFIALSCHILSMAPATNIGAAHPVLITGQQDKTMEEKVVNDTVSFIKSIASLRKRNVKWAEDAVRKSLSSTEKEALRVGVIDFIAKDINELLEKINNRKIKTSSGIKVIKSENVELKELRENIRERILEVLSNPNIAYILLLIGIWGIILEFSHPGFGIPGIVGTICLILAFFALHTLPINITGLFLIILSIILFIIEALTPTFGIFLISGLISLILGSIMLMKPLSELRISRSIMGVGIFITALFLSGIILFAWRTKKRKVITGKEGIIGETGKAITDISEEGTVFLHGEYWKAKSKSGVIKKGSYVKVVEVEGLTLIVEEK